MKILNYLLGFLIIYVFVLIFLFIFGYLIPKKRKRLLFAKGVISMPFLHGNEKLSIGRTGYYMEVVVYGQDSEEPGCMINLKDPSGTIIDRVVVHPSQASDIISLQMEQYSGNTDKPYFSRGEE